MKTLNRRDFPGAQYPDRIIQFGEGNFLRAFVDWQIDLLNEHTDLNAGIVVVRPIATDFPPSLNTQDGLYTTIIRGLNEQGEAVSDARLIRSVNREISAYADFDAFLRLAHNPEMRFVFSNTTEAGISYHAGLSRRRPAIKMLSLIPLSISTCSLSRGLPRWRPSCVSINCR